MTQPHLPALLLSSLLLTTPLLAQEGGPRYEIDQQSTTYSGPYERDGKLVYDVSFRIKELRAPGKDERTDAVVITENGREAYRFDLKRVGTEQLTVILAMDNSGSMARQSKSGKTKMREAQDAAQTFFQGLPPRANPGLILFDHEIRLNHPPLADPSQPQTAQRQSLLSEIESASPRGGTAYLDAAYTALGNLEKIKGARAVVVMTDGNDLNSKRSLAEVVRLARRLNIPVHVLGVGDQGWSDQVSTVLVLDQSRSMNASAGADKKTKMQALQDAAQRFVDLMRPGARATLLPFSSEVQVPEAFTSDHPLLKRRIDELTPFGGTSLYDAAFEGIETLVAANLPGKRYVVALTDGVDEDPGSRRDPVEVIVRARQEKIPLYMLGLGRREDVNEAIMKRMAEETGGKYYHAENQQKLFELFETLSIDIHGDGIDESALRQLASETRGRYYRAADASELQLIYQQLAGELQATHTITFPSLNQRKDGTVSAVDLYIEDASGNVISNTVQTDVVRPGLIVPEIEYRIYLFFLALLLVLLYLPRGLRLLATGR